MRRYLSCKKSLLVTSKVLRLFANTPTAYDKCSLLIRDTLMQPIQMHLSQKQKNFSEFFCDFFKCISNFKYFQKKMTPIAYVFPKLRTPKDVVRKMSIKSRLTGPIVRQHGKQAETQIQYQRQHLYHLH